MKYTKEQRLVIGRRIYDGELTRHAAAEEYKISEQTARDYMRLYRDVTSSRREREPSVSAGLPKQNLHQFQQG